jgi:hypothetical protein
MSADERRERDTGTSIADGVAGLMAAAAGAAGVMALVWYPGRVGPGAMLVALIAAAIADSQRRLAAGALALITACWLVGMILAILAERPVF